MGLILVLLNSAVTRQDSSLQKLGELLWILALYLFSLVNKLVFILACLEGNLALKSNLNESSKFEEPEKKSDQFFVTGVMKNSTVCLQAVSAFALST